MVFVREIRVYCNRTTGFPSSYNDKLSDASEQTLHVRRSLDFGTLSGKWIQTIRYTENTLVCFPIWGRCFFNDDNQRSSQSVHGRALSTVGISTI